MKLEEQIIIIDDLCDGVRQKSELSRKILVTNANKLIRKLKQLNSPKVYEFWFNDCTYESAPMCMSLHRTKKGAYRAMNDYLNKEFTDNRDQQMQMGKHDLWDHLFSKQAYGIREKTILE